MIPLLLFCAGTAGYCAVYAVHCFRKKHWLSAAVVSVLLLVPFCCGAAIVLLQ